MGRLVIDRVEVTGRYRPSGHERQVADLVGAMLPTAVLLWYERVRGWPETTRLERARSLATYIASHGDRLLFRTKANGRRDDVAGDGEGTADYFNRLAECCAILAHCPGGITFAGLRFEVVDG